MSATNVYASEPALPTLAHSLLYSTGYLSEADLASFEQTRPGNWSLQRDIENGFQCSQLTVFRSGSVVGFSRLKDRSSDEDRELIGQLPRQLLTIHLLNTSTQPNTFIIHPANFDAFSPQKLLSSLTSSRKLSPNEAIARLDSVQLLPVFDFASAVQAINEVSTILDTIHKSREKSREPTSSTPEPENDRPEVLLIVVGLDTLAESVIRASNPVKGTAVLSAALRRLMHISRLHAAFLSVLLVNTSGVGSDLARQSNATRQSNAPIQRGTQGQSQQTNEGIQSLFHETGTSLFPSLLMRTLEQGIDVHVLMSTVQMTRVVEVIKDREGDGLGRWCIWSRA